MAAFLVFELNGEVRKLLSQTQVGRALESDWVLSEPWVSGLHACFTWTEHGSWELRDLGSRNGTYVDGARLAQGERRCLRRGARVAFGDPAKAWCMQDDGAPAACARNLRTPQLRWSEDQILSLPGPDGEEVHIYEDREGNWVGEFGGEPRLVGDRECIQLGEESWRLSLPCEAMPTAENPQLTVQVEPSLELGGAGLRFLVSADQEHVLLEVIREGECLWSSDRVYAHVLLALARARLEDRRRMDLPASEHGWEYADTICRKLGFSDLTRLNVHIHRVRTELARAGVPDAPCVVERRRGTGQLRLGTAAIQIEDNAPKLKANK